MGDFYKVLGLNKECTEAELKAAYKKLALAKGESFEELKDLFESDIESQNLSSSSSSSSSNKRGSSAMSNESRIFTWGRREIRQQEEGETCLNLML
ncbi:hypothetical protein L1987_67192 [Smallanthus sonchifolius]|uniref:Uncharacterized protein n=1 Tax=Smallanthus sonchifolius TaxID=185202 RepID=A0ACB9BZF1_9ASTR|nr:hypothetical protein L1987_67192 [Smallanthus sonchifolius]